MRGNGKRVKIEMSIVRIGKRGNDINHLNYNCPETTTMMTSGDMRKENMKVQV